MGCVPLPQPKPLTPRDFLTLSEESFVLDTRTELSFGAAHVPGAQSIWIGGLASFVGWYVPLDRPILLVTETNNTDEEVRILIREGYDKIVGYLAGGMLNWHMTGNESSTIRTITVHELCNKLDYDKTKLANILDVRSDEERAKDGQIPGAKNIHVTQIPKRLNEVPKDDTFYIFCGSGLRSMVAASFLQRNGWNNLSVVLGGFAGWKSAKCHISILE
jgi:hydroxyacylglutathione hydrolase